MRRTFFWLVVVTPLFGIVLAGCDSGKQVSAPTAPVPRPVDKPKTNTAQ
jgi:hypothetical protein